MRCTVIVQKTAILKLYNPGTGKRALLDQVFARYSKAYIDTLERCRPMADLWIRDLHDGKRLPSPFNAMKEIRPLLSATDLPSALYDGLVSDILTNLVSYCKLRQAWEDRKNHEDATDEPQYPSPLYGYQSDGYQKALAEAAEWVGDPFDHQAWQSRLLREEREIVRPLLYVRARDFALERLDNEKWVVSLPVQPKPQKPTRLRFPLAFGIWHEEEYLTKGKARCACLCRRDGEYFLHISFEFQVESMERGEEETYLGVDRGIIKQAAYAIIDKEGRPLRVGSLGRDVRPLQILLGRKRQAAQRRGRHVRRQAWQRRHQEQMLHTIANALVALAVEHHSLVVMEDLNLQTSGAFIRSQYAKMGHILSYKLRMAGMLPPREVFAAYSSLICPRCGEDAKREGEDLYCPACDVNFDADEAAAVNIARRAFYRKAEWNTSGGYRGFHRSFGALRVGAK